MIHPCLAECENQQRAIVIAIETAAAKLDAIAASERSVADAEDNDGDEVHATMRRQNAWAFTKAAEVVRATLKGTK